MLNSIYNTVRQLIFTQIFHAPVIFNRATRNFIGLQQMSRLLPDYYEMCHCLSFDLCGNMGFRAENEPLEPNHFEAILIAKLESKEIYARDVQYVVLVGGNTTCYQVFIAEMIALHKKHGKNAYVIGFNPPGVGMSPGATHSQDDICAALKSIVDNLHNNGVPAQHIMLVGHSLGAAIAARVAAQFHEVDKRVKLFADRTMMSISEVVAVKIVATIPTQLLRRTLGAILYYLLKALVKLFKLELDVARDFVRINTITPGAARGMMTHEDEVILSSDLFHALPDNQQPYFKQFKLRLDKAFRKAHSQPRHELIDYDGLQNAEEYLDQCIKLKG
jgi:pimeloyl-ACP methyl ester carboxylesterase